MKVDYSIRMTNGYLISDFKFHKFVGSF